MNFKNWQLTDAEDDSDRKLLSDIKEYGWHLVVIQEDETGPTYSFTVGLHYTFQHPEIFVMGIAQENAHTVVSDIVSEIRKGKKFEENKKYSEFLVDLPVIFLSVSRNRYKEYLGYALWFYRSYEFEVLQLIWPDREARFPWDQGYDIRFNRLQRILKQKE